MVAQPSPEKHNLGDYFMRALDLSQL